MDPTQDPERRAREAKASAKLLFDTLRDPQAQAIVTPAQAGLPPPNADAQASPALVEALQQPKAQTTLRFSAQVDVCLSRGVTKARYQVYQEAARAQALKINQVFDQVGLVGVSAHPEVQVVEDGAFVEAMIWVPRSVLEGLDG